MSISLILLSGGKGTRMGHPLPKQYLPLNEKPLALHSLDVFLHHPEITQYIIVCAPAYQTYFSSYPVTFALPGERRQDSVYNGLQQVNNPWVCIHDAARPFITKHMLDSLIASGKTTQAATLAVPATSTFKCTDNQGYVTQTLTREHLWEVQTPQFLSKEILDQGFAHAIKYQLTVTDDVSLAELINHRVKLVPSSRKNIKITTPEDLILCQNINS